MGMQSKLPTIQGTLATLNLNLLVLSGHYIQRLPKKVEIEMIGHYIDFVKSFAKT